MAFTTVLLKSPKSLIYVLTTQTKIFFFFQKDSLAVNIVKMVKD